MYPDREAALTRHIAELERELEDVRTRPYPRSFGAVIGGDLGLPGLHGFWPCSSIESGTIYDQSGQARHLTATDITLGIYNSVVSYLDFNGSTSNGLRADEAGLDITGALTLGGWFYQDTLPTGGATRALLSKSNVATQRSYELAIVESGGSVFPRILITTGGSSATQFSIAGTIPILAASWHFIVGRFDPTVELAIFDNYNGVSGKTTNVASIPAAIFNSTSGFSMASYNGASGFMDGRGTLADLCAAVLPDALLVRLFQEGRSFLST